MWRRKHRDLLRSFDIRLKKIVLDCYRAKKPDIDFVTFFVLNARVLESMTVLVKRNDEEFLAKQRQKLLLESKASDGAEINFVLKVDANPGTYYSISL